jgi:hypothetical protein
MSLAPQLWLNIPNPLTCSRRGGLKAAPPGADNSRMRLLWVAGCPSLAKYAIRAKPEWMGINERLTQWGTSLFTQPAFVSRILMSSRFELPFSGSSTTITES